jgi:predicted PurR-regulated permease PerM
MSDENKQTLDISWGTILRVFLALVVIYLLYQVSEIIVWFVFALIISILFNPIVDVLRKARIPRVIGVITVYFGFFGIVALFAYLVTPGLYAEIKNFSLLLPEYIERISPFLQYIGVEGFATLDEIVETLRESSDQVTKSVFSGLLLIFGGFSTAFFIITMAIFLSLEGNGVEKAIKLMMPGGQEKQAVSIWKKCRKQVSSWFLVRILSCLFVGITSFFVFFLFGVNYALLFAIIGGIFNMIPFAGPAIAAVIFFVITSLDSLTQALFVFVAFLIIQAIEGSVISPALSKKIMGVSPALVLISIVVGGSLWGALGAFLAIPLLGIIFEFFKAFLEKKKEAEGVL